MQPKRQGGTWFFAVVVLTLGWGCRDASAPPIAETKQAACRPPSLAPAFRVVDALPGAKFDRPLSLARVGPDYLIAGQGGAVVRATRGESGWTTEPFLDVSGELAEDEAESGLIGFTTSPDYETRPEVFIAYTGRSELVTSVFRTVLARLSSNDGGRTIDPSTEEQMLSIERTVKGHNGGRLVFGPDRHLYVGIGDGSWGDPLLRAQDPNELFGKILRLDVLGARPYASPPDNPFFDGGGRPEVWAYGLRNPWSFSFAPDGQMWLGDVGHDYWEEIDIITKGGNYGWPLREGRHCFRSPPCEVPGAIDPVFEYGHVDGYAVTGGVVYRGKQAALAGTYVFGDFMTGRIWALDAREPGAARMLVDSARNISAFGEDEDGEVLLVDYGGHVLRLEAADEKPAAAESLASLGCLDPDRTGEVAPAFTSFDVSAPLWSDGLDKRRWISVPEGAQVHVTGDGKLDLPVGSILLKEFSVPGRRIETRMLARDADDGWLGYTFQWNEAQTDAVLIEDAVTVDVDGSPWTLPSRGQCFACHRTALGTVLGFVPEQLDRGDQLDAFARAGLLDRAVDHAAITPLVDPYDASLPAEPRARSYLAANCASCHGGAGSPQGVIDFRASIATADMFTVCRSAKSALDGAGSDEPRRLLIAPGDPAASEIVQRMSRTDVGSMPPIGRRRVDSRAVDVVSSWIRSLAACP
ncbi:MAG: PQQ-dependent sugar dehydrogenase [Labilithrix sp.]|nr:PQQ-dependent sugar dehydrogenase [Labilithrix sp.]